MIIPTDIAIAYACPYCGSVVYSKFSLFSLKKGSETEIPCGCGRTPCALGLGRNSDLYVLLWGECCDDPHEFGFDLAEFEQDTLLGLACDAANLGLGFIGSPEAVKMAATECPLPAEL